MIEWPHWWHWEFEMSAHLRRRMVDRRFNDVDVRVMLDEATGLWPDHESGRWVVQSRLGAVAWHLIVEPLELESRLVVIHCLPNLMNESTVYLEVSFRKGRALAAYVYLTRREGDQVSRCEESGNGMVIDYAADGRPIGIELTSPKSVTLEGLNDVLRRMNQPLLLAEDLQPLIAA